MLKHSALVAILTFTTLMGCGDSQEAAGNQGGTGGAAGSSGATGGQAGGSGSAQGGSTQAGGGSSTGGGGTGGAGNGGSAGNTGGSGQQDGGQGGSGTGGSLRDGGTADGGACGTTGSACGANQVCLELIVYLGPSQMTSWKCVANPCGAQPLACSCAGDICRNENQILSCTQAFPSEGRLRCAGGGVCAAPDTPIATPEGDRPIAELRPGDLVYSAEAEGFVAVPLLRVSRTPVKNHFVVHLRTEGGAVLDISAPHPTADGRTFGDLQIGDQLDGARIVSRELVPYPHSFTYDVLPASTTGTYVAGGLLIGSTLRQAGSSLEASW